jgi:hypothetical protein
LIRREHTCRAGKYSEIANRESRRECRPCDAAIANVLLRTQGKNQLSIAQAPATSLRDFDAGVCLAENTP